MREGGEREFVSDREKEKERECVKFFWIRKRVIESDIREILVRGRISKY